MSRLLDNLPVLVFRLAMVAILAVSLGVVLVITGASWNVGFRWTGRAVLWLGVPVTLWWLFRNAARSED